MKKLLLLLACSITIFATAQNIVNITTQQYQVLKQNHQLDLTRHYVFTDVAPSIGPVHYTGSSLSPSSICSCMITLDSSFSIVPFTNGTPPEYRNDDGSSNSISLPFNFNFNGVTHNSVFINNNGNISFDMPYSTYTADSFPSLNFNMIAPFWADVDTRDTGAGGVNGLVYYKITTTAMIIKWVNVGYYAIQTDKLNTFQLIITDGTDPLLPAGDNVGFCYGDMQWTTGSASSGVNGFGGVPATVGVNQGNGTDYFQVGRFDTAGVAFDGPYGSSDGIDWLDNQGFYFNAASVGNTPPIIINNNICDTIDVFTGDTTMAPLIDSVQFMIGVSTPEINQTVNATFTGNQPANLAYVLTTNTPTYKEYTCKYYVASLPEGLYYVDITATDDGIPIAQSHTSVIIHSHFDASLVGIHERDNGNSISIFPNPTENYITVKHSFNASSNPILSVNNVMGQNVMTYQLTSQSQSFDISKLSKGIYFATITSNEGKSKTIKVVRK